MKRYRPRLLTVRAPRKTEQGSRICKLFRAFVAKLDANNRNTKQWHSRRPN